MKWVENMEKIIEETKLVVNELLNCAKLKKGDICVIGCSTSEVTGNNPGTNSVPQLATELFNVIYKILNENGIYIAAQCCEHLNRAIVIESEVAEKYGYEPVNVIPQPKAGGSFATATYKGINHPVVVEKIRANAGIDIGGVLIGMHLKETAVPVPLKQRTIGQARIIAARTRPKFVGGVRAMYDESLM